MKAIREALERRFSSPGYTLLWEVRDSTGFGASRSADAMAIGMYRSRGFAIHGIEIKTARADWLAELKNPDKAERIGQFCDYFWLVTNDPAVAFVNELPEPWGYLCQTGKKLKTLKQAIQIRTKPLSREMLASILDRSRKSMEHDHAMKVREESNKMADLSISAELNAARSTRDRLEQLQKIVREFEDASGLHIEYGYQPAQKIGDAVRRVLHADESIRNHRRSITSLAEQARRIAGQLENEVQELAKIDFRQKELPLDQTLKFHEA